MGIFLANRDAPSRCTATDCLVQLYIMVLTWRAKQVVSSETETCLYNEVFRDLHFMTFTHITVP